jgi:hypothetical protein
MCGADFPLKVAALGESTSLGYSEAPRPPTGVGSSSQMPNWPPSQARYAPPPTQGEQLRWVPGPPPAGDPGDEPPPYRPAYNSPRAAPPQYQQPQYQQPQYQQPQYRPPQVSAPEVTAPAGRPVSLYPQCVAPPRDDVPDDTILPPQTTRPARAPSYEQRPAYHTRPAYNAPPPPPQQQPRYTPPALGPARAPASTGAILPATVTPAATLSCPIVSALDRWVSAGVQPAAFHWFGQQVVEIKQISAYSCRSMVGARTSHISEHAFGNALDIAGFVLADGRKIMIKDAWRGTPEEQGFLHDVQLYACQTFNTVLAPGYNAAHYNHFHVDLMRRKSGRRPCRPDAVPGEVVAAKARAVYASRHRGETYTGSIAGKPGKSMPQSMPGTSPAAVPGEDGLFDDDADDTVTGSISAKPRSTASVTPGADGEFDDDDDVTGSIGWPRVAPQSRAARENTFTPEDRQTRF